MLGKRSTTWTTSQPKNLVLRLGFVRRGFIVEAPAGLELSLSPRLALNTQSSSCLCLHSRQGFSFLACAS